MGAIAVGFSIASRTSDSDLHAQYTGAVNGSSAIRSQFLFALQIRGLLRCYTIA
jgi:hypothetical protein